MDIKIRPYQTKDFLQLKQLLIDTKLYYEKIDTRERIERKVAKDSKSVLVACDWEKIVGSVFILEDSGWVAFIFHLAVDKNYQGKGIGTKLVLEAERLIKSRNGQEVHLLIEEKNLGVVEFYKKIGYQEGKLYKWMEKDL